MSDIRGLFNRVPLEADVLVADESGQAARLLFRCPGCKLLHGPSVGPRGPDGGDRWTWNGSYDKPVFSPSLLVRWPQYKPEAQARDQAYYEIHGHFGERPHNPADWLQRVCHSFIGCNGAQPGQIIFLGDCTHELAGTTVDIPPYASEWD